MLPPRTKCPPSDSPRKPKPDPRSAKRGQFMGKATKYKKYLAGLKAATAGGGKGSGKGGSEFIKRRMILADPEKTTNLGNPRKKGAPFLERRITLSGAGSALGRAAKASKYGKIALGIAGAGIAAQQYLKKKWKKNKDGTPKKKMGGGMMQRPMGYKGGGMDTGKVGEMKSKLGVLSNKFKRDGMRLTDRDIETANEILKGGKGKASRSTQEMISRLKKFDLTKKMGGGMMKKYNKGMTDKTFTDPKTAMIAHSLKNKDKITENERRTAKFLEKKGAPGIISKGKINTKRKMGGGMMMRPRGYKIGTGKKPLEIAMNERRARQAENVKRLTTQSDAYDPETRYIFGERRTRSGGVRVGKKTTDWSNLKAEAKKVKDKYPRMNVGVYTPKEARLAGYVRERRRPRSPLGRPRSTLANQAQQQSAMAKKQKMNIGGSVTVKTKIGKNFPTKTY